MTIFGQQRNIWKVWRDVISIQCRKTAKEQFLNSQTPLYQCIYHITLINVPVNNFKSAKLSLKTLNTWYLTPEVLYLVLTDYTRQRVKTTSNS